jgi:Ca-activated chloride channel family protein
MNDNENIQFGAPMMLWIALAAVPCVVLFFVWVWRRKQAAMNLFIPTRLFETLLVGYSAKREKIRYGLLGTALILALLALTSPRWGYDWEEVRQKGLDVVVAVDTSRSMLAPDIAPNRLERARLACIDLMRAAKTDRLGLVAFAGSAFLQCPLTFDNEAFRLSLNALDTGIIPQGGSSLAEAIKTAQESFKQDEDNHKVLILITDGEDHEEGAVEAAKAAVKAGIKIYTIGAGTPNGELLSFKGANGKQDFIRDDAGNIVRSKLNEGLLREIATVGGGFYLPLSGAKTMETLYQHPQGLGSLPKSDSQAKFVRRYQERYQWPLAFAFVLLLVEWVIQTRPATKEVPAAGKSPAIAPAKSAVTALLLLTMTLSAFASPSEARKAYEKGDYRSALEEYSRLAKERPDDARLQYNAGAAAYRAEDYETAANRFNDALRTTDLELQRNAYYNRANARYLQGDKTAEAGDKQKFWESSLEDYERALKLKKDDADAAYNRDLVKRKLEELKKQQEQQQKQPDNKNQDNKDNKDDKKDKQKQDKNEQQQKQDSKQNEQQSKDQQKGQKQDDKQKEDQKKQAEKDKQEQAKKDQQKQDEQKGDQDSAQQQAKKQSDGKQDKQGDKKPDEQGGQPMMAQGNAEMTQQQVMQLLDTLKAQEKALIFQPPGDAKNRPKSFKDW